MAENKTKPNQISLDSFLSSIDDKRQGEAAALIGMMKKVSGLQPVMWGPSIIGFGRKHYKYDSGHEGDMALIGFSPRKTAITVYFSEGFDRYGAELQKLGKHKTSVSCLYINKLEDVDIKILREMVESSYKVNTDDPKKLTTVEDYVAQVPVAARAMFDELRVLVKNELPGASEIHNYGIIGYKIDDKRARVFVSGWKDHVSVYPIPRDETLQADLKPYIKGKGTLWFPLDKPLPKDLIKKVVHALVK